MKTSPNLNKLKYKKFHKANSTFLTSADKKVFFLADGEYAIKSVESGKLTFKQIEACRRALRRGLGKMNKSNKIYIKVFPCVSVTQKPIASRMGKGKGAISHWIAPVKKGQILFEINCVDLNKAMLTLTKAVTKLPVKTKIVDIVY